MRVQPELAVRTFSTQTYGPIIRCRLRRKAAGQKGNFVTTSSSIVTIPIIEKTPAGGFPPSGGNVTIVGYMQAFINQVHGGGNPHHQGDIDITVLNIAGCGSASTNLGVTPVIGGSGTSPVPVRLITP